MSDMTGSTPTAGTIEPAGRDQIVAMFESLSRAREARDRLIGHGVPGSDIQILAREATEADATIAYERTDKGFWNALKRLFVPEPEAPVFAESLRRGDAMLVVTRTAGRHGEIVKLLEEMEPIDLEEREREWRAAGWTETRAAGHGQMGRSQLDRPAMEASAVGLGPAGTEPVSGVPQGKNEADAIPLAEEKITIGKRRVQRPGVRVHSYVIEEPVEKDVSLRQERIRVERRPVDRPTGDLPEDAFRERSIEIDATSEEPVIRKDARVVEELVVNKESEDVVETVRDKVRRTEVKIEDDRSGRVTPPPAGKPPRR